MATSEIDFVEILRVLDAHGVEFLVVGALAASLQGARLVIFDLDIDHRRTEGNVGQLSAALRALEAIYLDPAGRRLTPDSNALLTGGHHLLSTRAGPLDVFGAIEGGRGYDELAGRTVALDVGRGLRIRVLGLEALVELKSESTREKDRAAFPILKRTLEVSTQERLIR